jgi:hypothetical protein
MRIRSTIAAHPIAVAVGAIAGVGAIAFVLAFFEPQALFIDDEVSEAVPTVAGATGQGGSERGAAGGSEKGGTEVTAEGSFVGIEGHSAGGTAQVLDLPDDSRFLRFEEDFDVTNGPDLKVYLSAAPQDAPGDALDDEFVDLGDLKGNIGSQNYELPAEVDIDRYRTTIVWCKRFSVGFATAQLR